MQHLVIIPGIGATVVWYKFLTRNWEKKYGTKTHLLFFGWNGKASEFPEKFKKIERHLDEYIKENENVSILGISAGGSAAVNLFIPRRDKIKNVVTVCGRVRDPNVRQMWNHRPKALVLYEESVKLSEANLDKLSQEDKKRILTIRPIYDEIVPLRTMIIDGAENRRIFAAQHMVSISLAMTLYSKIIADFVKKN